MSKSPSPLSSPSGDPVRRIHRSVGVATKVSIATADCLLEKADTKRHAPVIAAISAAYRIVANHCVARGDDIYRSFLDRHSIDSLIIHLQSCLVNSSMTVFWSLVQG